LIQAPQRVYLATKVIIESDSASAVQFLDEGCGITYVYCPPVRRIKEIYMSFDTMIWVLVFREANGVIEIV